MYKTLLVLSLLSTINTKASDAPSWITRAWNGVVYIATFGHGKIRSHGKTEGRLELLTAALQEKTIQLDAANNTAEAARAALLEATLNAGATPAQIAHLMNAITGLHKDVTAVSNATATVQTSVDAANGTLNVVLTTVQETSGWTKAGTVCSAFGAMGTVYTIAKDIKHYTCPSPEDLAKTASATRTLEQENLILQLIRTKKDLYRCVAQHKRDTHDENGVPTSCTDKLVAYEEVAGPAEGRKIELEIAHKE